MSRERRLKKWLRLAYGVLSLRMSSVLLSGPKMKLFRATLGPTLSKTFQFYLLYLLLRKRGALRAGNPSI
jgi:hypothetical protein